MFVILHFIIWPISSNLWHLELLIFWQLAIGKYVKKKTQIVIMEWPCSGFTCISVFDVSCVLVDPPDICFYINHIIFTIDLSIWFVWRKKSKKRLCTKKMYIFSSGCGPHTVGEEWIHVFHFFAFLCRQKSLT